MKNNLKEIIKQLEVVRKEALLDASEVIRQEIYDISRVDTGQTRTTYDYVVDDKGESTIGSYYDNAIWEEYGTGKFAEDGKGRRPGWFYKNEETGTWHFTEGKRAHRPMRKAYADKKAEAIKEIENAFKEEFK